MSNSGGRANASSSSPGATGAPGDGNNTCGSAGCHSQGAFTVSQLIELINSDGEVVDEYLPNAEYTVRVTNTSDGNPAGYGFQMLSLLDNDDSVYNAWSNAGSGVGIVDVGGKSYAEHTSTSSSGVFEVMWTAPAKDSGPVVFYTGGNAVNGNGSPAGDGSVTTDLKVEEGVETSTIDLIFSEVEIFPNPTNSITQIKSEELMDGVITVSNLLGKTVIKSAIKSEQMEINLEAYQSGVYLLNFRSNNGLGGFTRRLVKK